MPGSVAGDCVDCGWPWGVGHVCRSPRPEYGGRSGDAPPALADCIVCGGCGDDVDGSNDGCGWCNGTGKVPSDSDSAKPSTTDSEAGGVK